jgi:GNAT superfamily N-acetyltransferase
MLMQTWTTRDGIEMELRPIHVDDADLLMSFVKHLSFGTRYFRYGRGNFELRDEEVQSVCQPDPERCVHLLVLSRKATNQAVVGSGRIVYEAGETSCELGMSVTDSWQRHGVGRRLLEALIETARRKGQTQMWASVLATNRAMIAFLLRRGFLVSDDRDGMAIKIARLAL